MTTDTDNRGFAPNLRERAVALLDAIVSPGRRWRLLLSIGLVALLAFFFWTGSRYPDLNDKAIMSGAIHLEDPLSFEALIEVRDEQPAAQRVLYTTLNWVKTNRKGMTFGVLFGAAFLTLLGYLLRRNFQNGFANAGMGMMMGAPLGVCVNCAAPVAKGLYSGGSRAETTLAAMIASPTLNVVVLFGLLYGRVPDAIFYTKLALSFLLILIGVPLIVRLLKPQDLEISAADGAACPIPDPPQKGAGREGLRQAVIGFASDFAQNLWFILRLTVPLMLLAGFLGALFATLVPPQYLAEWDFGIGGLIAAAAVGTIAPVPIGFDAVFSIALLSGGMSPGYVMTLLFTLGTYSIYSFLIVGSTISWRAAWLVAGAVAVLGVIGGVGVQSYIEWEREKAIERVREQFEETAWRLDPVHVSARFETARL